MRQRGGPRRGTDPDRLATALPAALQGGLLLTQAHRDTAPLETVLGAMLDHIESLTTRRHRTATREQAT